MAKGSTGTPTNIWRSSSYYKNKAKRQRAKKREAQKRFERKHAKLDPIMIKAKAGCVESQKILMEKWNIKVILPP